MIPFFFDLIVNPMIEFSIDYNFKKKQLNFFDCSVARSSLTKISPAAKPNILPLMKSVNNLTSSDLVSNLV